MISNRKPRFNNGDKVVMLHRVNINSQTIGDMIEVEIDHLLPGWSLLYHYIVKNAETGKTYRVGEDQLFDGYEDPKLLETVSHYESLRKGIMHRFESKLLNAKSELERISKMKYKILNHGKDSV